MQSGDLEPCWSPDSYSAPSMYVYKRVSRWCTFYPIDERDAQRDYSLYVDGRECTYSEKLLIKWRLGDAETHTVTLGCSGSVLLSIMCLDSMYDYANNKYERRLHYSV